MIESDYLKQTDKLMIDLRKIPTLKSFDEKELNMLLNMSKIRKFKQGEPICKEGHHDSWVYFLVNGKVQIVKRDKDLMVLERRGEVFGEMGPIDGSPRSASVYAVENTICLATDAFYIDKLKGQDKIAFGYVLYRLFAEILARRLRVSNRKLVKVKERFSVEGIRNLFTKILPSYN